MQTLPQRGSIESAARPVSEILAKANPAEMPAMRASLSFLTSAGAELATALARRNKEYDDLMGIVSVLPPEWIEAARTGSSLPDVGSLRAELELAKDERIDLHGQLVERDRQISALQEQLAQLPVAPPAGLAEDGASAVDVDLLQAQLESLQGELDKAALARAQAEDDLKVSEAELNHIDNLLASLRADLEAALPEDTTAPIPATPTEESALPEDAEAQIPAAPAEEPAPDPRQRRAMRLGALAASVSALIDRNRQQEEQVQVANALVASVSEQFEIVSADRMALEADLQEKVQTLEYQQTQLEQLQSQAEALNAQIEQATEQTAVLQADLDNTVAAKAQLEEQLQLREGELAELNQQIDSISQQLMAVLPEDVVAQLTPAEDEAPAAESEAPVTEGEEPAVEGEITAEGDVATRSAAPMMLGLGALAAGVAAAVDLSNEKVGEADQANAQLAAALALQADLEQQLGERTGQISDLEGQIQDAVSRLQEIVPAEGVPQSETLEATDVEVEGEVASVEVEGEAVEAEAEGDERAAKGAGLAALVASVAAVVDRNNSSIAELEAQIDGLTQEKASLDAALAEKEQELAGYNDYSLNLQGQVNELAAQVAGVEAALTVKEQAEAEAQAQIEALNAQIEALNAQVADLQTQLDAAVSAKAELEQALQATQAQLDAAQAELSQIDEESQRVLGDKAGRLGAVGAGAAAIAAIKDKEEELAAANEQVLALQTQVDDLSAERDSIVLGKDELQTTLQGREDELADLRSQLDALQGQMAGALEERSALQEQLAQIEESMGEVAAQRSTGLSFEAATEFSEALARLPAIKSHAASAAIVAGVQPTLSPRIQALTDVKGIGSVYQQRLYKAGVGTYWELASLPDSDMQETLQIPDLQRLRIDFEETRADAYEWAKQTDTVGLLWDGDHVDDFESLPGIGKTFEKRLYEAGITTYEQLADLDGARLAEIVQAPPMREIDYEELKQRAQALVAERLAIQPAE